MVVADLGWVDFDSDVPSSCPAAQPVLPNPHWPQQNRADIGTSKYKSTQPRSATTSVTHIIYIAITINKPSPFLGKFLTLKCSWWLGVGRVGLGAVWQGGGVGQGWGLEVGQGRRGGQK